MRMLDASNQVIEAALGLQHARMFAMSHPYVDHAHDEVSVYECLLDEAVGRYAQERQRELGAIKAGG